MPSSDSTPALTAVADDDFLFRTALSDVSQGPVLARLARERGFDNVGLLHVDDAWGRGLAGAFEAAWDGAVEVVPVDRTETDFLTALRESASGGAQALVVIAFESAALAMVREAVSAKRLRAGVTLVPFQSAPTAHACRAYPETRPSRSMAHALRSRQQNPIAKIKRKCFRHQSRPPHFG